MKTSARNELSGKIIDIKSGEVMSEVKVEVAPSVIISATITKESTNSLGLDIGSEVSALVKSSSVIISKEQLKATARNIIKAEIVDIKSGQVNSEVKLKVGENVICAVITNEAVEDLNLTVGSIAYGIFKASSVILVA
ncbi:TOBE domain-containing protein [Halarcobacter sp.]|uniref:TOBE domain-containing protein n=1 Tax=Halarcobacter sp. TaxID=2321133 RepID=UPI0029F51A6D|nr:TOBE domain-containing protein [Halarcobacter sp.]